MATTEDRYISLLTDSPKELYEYEDSLKTYRDLKNNLDTAEEKGVVKGIQIGRAEEKIAIAQKMKANGMSTAIILEMTGLSVEDIEEL